MSPQPPPADERRAFTVPEVADMYGVSTGHIRKLIRNGIVQKVPHMGTRVLVSAGELRRVFEAAA